MEKNKPSSEEKPVASKKAQVDAPPATPHACARCGSIDHQKCTSKLCEFYKPQLKLAEKEDGRAECTSVVTIGLNQFLKEKKLNPVILSAVANMTAIMVEGSQFLNGFLLHLLDTGQDIPNLSTGAGGLL